MAGQSPASPAPRALGREAARVHEDDVEVDLDEDRGPDRSSAAQEVVLPDHLEDVMAAVIAEMNPTRPEILRAAPVGNVLGRLGRPFRSKKGDFYGMSGQTSRIHTFWSHSWHSSVWMKIATLLFFKNGTAAAVISLASVACVVPLYVLHVLPEFTEQCGWCSLVGSASYVLTLIFWRRSELVFVDRCCIHQTNPQLKAEGLVSLGAIIKSSDALLVLWDPTYAQRLWCMLELAAFLHSHPEKSLRQIVVQPTITGAFREYYRDVDMLGVQFGSFDFAFHHQVQSEVKAALVEQLTTQVLSYWHMVKLGVPAFHYWADLFTGNLERKLTSGEVSKIPYDLLLLGLTYWLAMIPTVALVLQRLGYVFRRQRSWTSLDVLQSSLLVACGTLVMTGYSYMEGAVGDCWFLSALAVIAERPDLILRLFRGETTTQRSGRYEVQLFLEGKWTTVVVDDQLPCIGSAAQRRPDGSGLAFSRAKAHGSYKAISGGSVAEALLDLTGAPCESKDVMQTRTHTKTSNATRTALNIRKLQRTSASGIDLEDLD
ncbi:CAPN15, partial [Symbiodinium microadriaticum]